MGLASALPNLTPSKEGQMVRLRFASSQPLHRVTLCGLRLREEGKVATLLATALTLLSRRVVKAAVREVYREVRFYAAVVRANLFGSPTKEPGPQRRFMRPLKPDGFQGKNSAYYTEDSILARSHLPEYDRCKIYLQRNFWITKLCTDHVTRCANLGVRSFLASWRRDDLKSVKIAARDT
ncbi:hypothetical protein MRX96_010907 [Rhipicephalus microplus]